MRGSAMARNHRVRAGVDRRELALTFLRACCLRSLRHARNIAPSAVIAAIPLQNLTNRRRITSVA
jgi:hypothetical protein